MQKQRKKPPLFFKNQNIIIDALNNGAKTYHEIYMITELSYYTIRKHKKHIKQCSRCKKYFNDSHTCSCICVEQYNKNVYKTV